MLLSTPTMSHYIEGAGRLEALLIPELSLTLRA